MLRNHLLLLFFVSISAVAYSFEWNRGVVQIDQIDPGIRFSKYGGLYSEISSEALPLEFSQLAKFSTDNPAKLFFRLSTCVLGKWEGPGKVTIEAFDHSWVQTGLLDDAFDELTRTILYFDKGFLFINTADLKKASSIRIETPLGMVISYSGIFSIRLEEFEDSAERSAMIECYQGSLVYTDQKGDTHSLRDGNKMPIMLKDDSLKVTVIELDALEQRAVGNFNKERVDFIEANTYPAVERPTQVDSENRDSLEDKNESVQEYYYFPVIEQIKSFNPYKKSYRDD